LALTRQALPVYDPAVTGSGTGVSRGAYVLASLGRKKPDIILMASGSEVSLVLGAAAKLAQNGVAVRVVSFPSWSLFEKQTPAYRRSVLPDDAPLRLAVEAGVAQGWERYVGAQGRILSIERFGASSPYKMIFEQLGFTVDNVAAQARALLRSAKTRRAAARKPRPVRVVRKGTKRR
jgi:transketolase